MVVECIDGALYHCGTIDAVVTHFNDAFLDSVAKLAMIVLIQVSLTLLSIDICYVSHDPMLGSDAMYCFEASVSS